MTIIALPPELPYERLCLLLGIATGMAVKEADKKTAENFREAYEHISRNTHDIALTRWSEFLNGH